MTKELTIEVSNLYCDMYKKINENVEEDEINKQFESLIHKMYQEIESQKIEKISTEED